LQDAQLATQAQEQGRAQTTFGAGLFGTGIDLASAGYNPLKTQFGLAQSLESAGQNALDLGLNVGGRSAQSGANVGNTLLKGSVLASEAMKDANSYNPWATALQAAGGNRQLTQGVGNLFGGGGVIDRTMNPSGNIWQTGQYADPGYWT
jgi:hypothetical protein